MLIDQANEVKDFDIKTLDEKLNLKLKHARQRNSAFGEQTDTLFTSAVMAEIVRGGLNSIPRGQFEAAQSQGFGFFATMRYIILPQTFKTIIPALFSQCTTVIKDSSYLSGINVAELMYTANVVMAHAIDLSQVLMLYGLVFAMYFVLHFGISLLVRAYQRRMVAA